jgi:medium-chain acyl-[acyl-carrier-protein] hydrolase
VARNARVELIQAGDAMHTPTNEQYRLLPPETRNPGAGDRSHDRAAWMTPINRPQNVRLRVFCFPYAGAGPYIFAPWANAFPDGVEICAIQLPGRAARIREQPFTALGPLVDAIGEQIAPSLRTPFILLGHSLGALIAFEVARHVRRRFGSNPAQLIVCACRAPHLPHPQPILHDLPEEQFIEALRHLNGTPEELLQQPGVIKLIAPALRADLAVFETYEYRNDAPLACPIRAFGGLGDVRTAADELRLWRQHTTGPFTAQCVPGGHFFIHQSGNLLVRLLATIVYEVLRDGP